MTEIEVNRNSHLIDPVMHIWGWEIPVYLFLGGLAAGMMILSAAMALRDVDGRRSKWARFAPFAAPILLSIGMAALFADLEFKSHVFRFYFALRVTSPMSWGSWILLGIYPATILLGLASMTESERVAATSWNPRCPVVVGQTLDRLWRWARSNVAMLAKINIALGVLLGGYTGVLLGTLAARAAWNSIFLGPLFLVSGLSTGAALFMLFLVSADEHHRLRRWDLVAIGVEILLLAMFFLALAGGGGQTGRDAATLFFGGPFTAVFWSLVVAVGLIVPAVLELLESRLGLRPARLAQALILIGGLSLRWILVLAGQASV
ncbi:MAG: polysulfide reductase NrfD [Deltaproteobacteria bacterium]|nr:polysulfide reductase NrfD [Deltaproteobacteria bacterium]